jgi:hypothetical protein
VEIEIIFYIILMDFEDKEDTEDTKLPD